MKLKPLLIYLIVFLIYSNSILAQNTTPFWSLNGNNNGNSGSFLGTTNNLDLPIFTNSTERIRIDATNGHVGIGTATSSTTPKTLLMVQTMEQTKAPA